MLLSVRKSFTREWNGHVEDFWGMRKCCGGEHLNHICFFVHVHEIETSEAYSGLSDNCILRSQNMLTSIASCDRNCLPTAELKRHYLQHGRDHQTNYIACIELVHAINSVFEARSTVPCAHS